MLRAHGIAQITAVGPQVPQYTPQGVVNGLVLSEVLPNGRGRNELTKRRRDNEG